MLKRLYIDNFKCLTNFEVRPPQISCLVGPNGSGKSAVLEVLRGLQVVLGAGATVEDAFPGYSRTRWDTRTTQRVELDIQSTDGPLFHYALQIRHDEERRRAVVEREAVSADDRLLYEHAESEIRLFGDMPTAAPRTSFPFDPRRSFLPLLEPRPDNKLLTTFKQWIWGMWLFALRPSELDEASLEEAEALSTNGRNFVSWFRSLLQESPDIADRVRNSIDPVVPGLTGIRLIKQGRDSRLMLLDCEVTGRRFSLALPEISDGQRSLLVLYTVLHALARRASLLVFDEPDNFVAQSEIQPWLSELREAVVDGGKGTLMVISHHPEVIDYLAADQALKMWRGAEGPARVAEVDVDRETGMSASKWLQLEGAVVE